MQHYIQPQPIDGSHQLTKPIKVNFGTTTRESRPVTYMQYPFKTVGVGYTVEVFDQHKAAAEASILVRLANLYDTLLGQDDEYPHSMVEEGAVVREHHKEMINELSDIIRGVTADS